MYGQQNIKNIFNHYLDLPKNQRIPLLQKYRFTKGVRSLSYINSNMYANI